MNVALSGFMGAGKTTTARHLARILKRPYIDTDAEIERERGPISDIFAREGAKQFRAYETELLKRIVAQGPCVIALGGGAVMDPANRALLRQVGVIVHLSISAEGAFARVARRKHRPLLGPAPDISTIRKLLADRRQAYADHDFAVTVDGKSAIAVAHIIARWLRRRCVEPVRVL